MSADAGGPLPRDGSVVVAGASLAGLRAAQELREGGFAGSLVMVGEEMHYPYDRPPLSKQVLAGTWPPERTVLADRDRIVELGIDLRLGRRAEGLDAAARRVTLDDGTVLEADGVVVATGARPRRLRGTEASEGVAVVRTIDDCERLRAAVLAAGEGCRVVVVGAGFIGSEVAATCTELACAVTVLEALPVPLETALGELVGGALGDLHLRHGVTLRTGAAVTEVRPLERRGGAPYEVALVDGNVLPADVVVVGIGVVPNTEWLGGSGLHVADGVECDAALFAADGVVCAGDLCRWTWRHLGEEQSVRIEHWEVASQMGTAAARSLLAGRALAQPFDPVPYFWSDQYGLRIQVLGHPDPGDEVAVVDGALEAEDGKFVAVYGRNGRLSGVLAVSRPRQLMAFRPLLVGGASFDDGVALLTAKS
ncbi:MAG TPA: FAD-dependent oxidoreductase [Acidimicrobiales bacterium]|nr:FAD-dependent oxidoreductase [Acidimicrobiales bacterium]